MLKSFLPKIIFLFLLTVTSRSFSYDTLPTVPYVNIQSYLGDWYEIARLPNSFEKKCAGVKANYSLDKKGRVVVVNSCNDASNPGVTHTANGLARIKDTTTNSKLSVSFVPFLKEWGLFAGPYWILDLDANYQYALVGSPDRDYLWVLSREKSMDESILKDLLAKAQSLGFDISKIIYTKEFQE